MKHPGLSELLTGVLSDHQLELDDLEVVPAGRRKVVRVIVDGDGRTGRGPDLDQIADVTRAISEQLDAYPGLGDTPYTLEVSSRGVSRPLTRPAHYRRNVGRLLALTLLDGSQLIGRITEADEESVSLDVDDQPRVIALAQVGKAVVQVEMNRRLQDLEDEVLEDSDDDFEEE